MGKISNNLNWILFRISWKERVKIAEFILTLPVIFAWQGKAKLKANSLYNLSDLASFGSYLRQLVRHDVTLAKIILNPIARGARAWEYGKMMAVVDFKPGMKVLDVGSGRSTLPVYLARKGASVWSLDLPDAFEEQSWQKKQLPENLEMIRGSMEKIPIKKDSFDIVLCLSAIEHLDYINKDNKFVSMVQYRQRVVKALSEMVRVLKKGGKLFLTTDVYLEERQKSDEYSRWHDFPGIKGAFKTSWWPLWFLEIIEDLGCELVGGVDYDFEKLVADDNRSIYRGRFFTTVCLYAQKS